MSYVVVYNPTGDYATICTEEYGRRESILQVYKEEGNWGTPCFRSISLAETVAKYLNTGQAAVRKAIQLHQPTNDKIYCQDAEGLNVVAKACKTCRTAFPCKTRVLLDEC